MKKYKLSMLDMCLPDYFGGYHNPVMQIPVCQEMTKTELVDAIVSEYNMVWDYLCTGHDNPWPNFTEEAVTQMANTLIIRDRPFEHAEIARCDELEDTVESVHLFLICEEDN